MARTSLLLLSLLSISISLLKTHANNVANMTRLHFYMHDTVTSPNPTAIQVIKGPSKYNGSGQLGFGSVLIIDDPLTESPNLSSKLMGRAQGYYAFAGLSGTELLLSMNILLKGSEYNGSSISVFGRDSILEKIRELPIIGGSGKFRMARGYILIKTSSYVPSTNNAVLEIEVYVDNSSSSTIDERADPSSSHDSSKSNGDSFLSCIRYLCNFIVGFVLLSW